ncbi:MAG: alpha-amylase family glycosyl hydrolase [Longimonas sp.]|uniref:alpha-amylase family glycosyl hydrolase n=1 Tax=Longimonas sp. TaxID=2039626 RepID=UPI0033447580
MATTRYFSLSTLLAAAVLAFMLAGGCEAPDAPPPSEASSAASDVSDAVIYEMFIPDFSPEGTFQGAIERFDHLEQLGVNTIWLMPIHPIGEERAKTDIGELGSPYSIRDFYGVNPDYGTKDDLQDFVSAAHERNMRVILDLVANHTAWDHPWTEEHPEWYADGPEDGFSIPVMDGDTTDWTDVVQLNHDSEALHDEMIAMMQYWVREHDIDGYRADVAGLVPFDFWERAIDSLRTVKDPVFMLAEDAQPEMHDVGFDLTYAWPFYGSLVDTWAGEQSLPELIDVIESVESELPAGALRMRFTTNHDETAWDAPPPALFGGHEGSKAAFVFATTLPGVPLIYNGQELGVEEPVPFFEATPYDWNRDDTLMPFYTEYMGIYTTSSALRRGTLDILTPDAEDAVLYRRVHDNEELLIAVNIRDASTTVSLPAAHQGRTWEDAFSGDTTTVNTSLELDAYEYQIMRAVE